MTSWGEFENAAPDLAKIGRERFERYGFALLGTVRRDGSPRVSPCEIQIVDGEVLLGMMWRSTKALDLLRDPRILVHNAVASRDGVEGEFKVRGTVVELDAPDVRERYADVVEAAIDWRPKDPYHLFRVDIEDVAFVWYDPKAPEGEEKRVQTWSGTPDA